MVLGGDNVISKNAQVSLISQQFSPGASHPIIAVCHVHSSGFGHQLDMAWKGEMVQGWGEASKNQVWGDS